MAKTEVYSWRVDPAKKAALEDAAQASERSVAALLDAIVTDWLSRSDSRPGAAEQERLHRAAQRFIGAIEGNDPDRAKSARERIRERLAHQRASS